jgi:hypothetical protein
MKTLNNEAKNKSRDYQDFNASFMPVNKLGADGSNIDDVFESAQKNRVRVSLHAMHKTEIKRQQPDLDSECNSTKDAAATPEQSDNEENSIEDELERCAEAHLDALLTFNKPNVQRDLHKGPDDAARKKLMPCFAAFRDGVNKCPNGRNCPYSHDPKVLEAHGERMKAKKGIPRKI